MKRISQTRQQIWQADARPGGRCVM